MGYIILILSYYSGWIVDLNKKSQIHIKMINFVYIPQIKPNVVMLHDHYFSTLLVALVALSFVVHYRKT